jgi:hypothetical protein
MLGQQFMHNAGVPYKFCLEMGTQSVSDCASVIRDVLALLQRRTRMLVPSAEEFNELLSVAYMEGQKMDVLPSYVGLMGSITVMMNRGYTISSPQ